MQGLIAWFVKNPIAANMLMFGIVVSGFFGLRNLDNEMFPALELTSVSVSVIYPGAGSQEVEEQICIRIEEAVADLEGIKEIRSTAQQSLGTVVIEGVSGWDTQRLLTDVKSRVDAIDTFPADSERPIVSEVVFRAQVLNLALFGSLDESDMKAIAEDIKQDITAIPGVGKVELYGAREPELSVEISAQTLKAHQISFDDVVQAIRKNSINLPAGQVRNSEKGDIQIQTYGQAYTEADFANIPILSMVDGSRLLLGDLATINDGFQEKNLSGFFNNKLSFNLQAYVTEEPDFIGVGERINQYIQERRQTLPEGLDLTIWFNFATYLEDRMGIMTSNALQGLVLVFLLLMLFLRPILAMWVVVGLAVAYLGTLTAMSVFGVTLSIASSFAFILILGIVVDDAIVVSESIYSEYESHANGPSAAIHGAQRVAKPVVIAVMTTVVVFLPMLLSTGQAASMFTPMAIVAITALLFSLVESFFILPSHLSTMQPEKPPGNPVAMFVHNLRHRFSGWFDKVVANNYLPLLQRCLQNRALTVSVFCVGSVLVMAIFLGGWIKVSLSPDIQGEMVQAYVTLRDGEGFSRSQQIKDRLVTAVDHMRENEGLINKEGKPIIDNVAGWVQDSGVVVLVGLISNEERSITARQVAELWRKYIGEIKDIEDFNIISSQTRQVGEKDITLQLRGNNSDELERVSAEITRIMGNFEGVHEISDSLKTAQREIRIKLKPDASTLGVGLADIARQVRYAFYGAEVQRIPRLREDVKVLVRYPWDQRQSIDALNSMWLQTNAGQEVPFSTVAEIDYETGYSEIKRVDRQRIVEIRANVNNQVADANQVVKQIIQDYWPEISKTSPGLSLALAGSQKEEAEFSGEMTLAGILVLIAIYTLLAVEFKSYIQPAIIMSAIPFGFCGGLIGHMLLGYTVSMLSVFGFMATAGVVVNDNLVLLDRINRLREQGMSISEAIIQGGKNRLRPIILTSLTTFFGLTPILFSKSQSAAFLKPMVTTMAFGVLFASFITVLLVPVLYSLVEEFKQRRGFQARAEIDLTTAG